MAPPHSADSVALPTSPASTLVRGSLGLCLGPLCLILVGLGKGERVPCELRDLVTCGMTLFYSDFLPD